jgi:hypothetical protein
MGLTWDLAGVAMGFTVTVPAGTQTLAVAVSIGTHKYRLVGLTPNWNATVSWRGKTASGFTLIFSVPPEDADAEVDGRIEL